MRLLAYISPADDADAVRRHLLAQPGVVRVACRAGHYWRADSQVERSYSQVWAPGYPAILAAYSAAGVTACTLPGPGQPADLPELTTLLTTLPLAAAVAVICRGAHCRAELSAYPLADDTVIAVNQSGHLVPEPARVDYVVANDGFGDSTRAQAPGRVQVCRRVHAATVLRPWFALDRLGITDSRFSILCALALAQHLGAGVVTLYGHDCSAKAAIGGTWDRSRLSACDAETLAALVALAATGVRVQHARWDAAARKPYLHTYASPTP